MWATHIGGRGGRLLGPGIVCTVDKGMMGLENGYSTLGQWYALVKGKIDISAIGWASRVASKRILADTPPGSPH